MRGRLAIAAALAAALVAHGCAKSSDKKSDAGTPNVNCGGADRACLTGVVTTAATVDAATPSGVADATISLADGTVLGTTNQQGWYFVKNVPAGARVPVCFEADGYARRCRNLTTAGGQNVQVSNTGLLSRNGFTGAVDAAAGGTIVLNGNTQITFPAASACLAGGGAPSGTVACALTPIVGAVEAQRRLAPGNFRGAPLSGAESQLVTGGMMEIACRDSNQAPVNVCAGKTVTVRFPVDAATCSNTALHPATMKSWGFDEATGLWQEYGTFSKSCGASNYYEGAVNHFSYWNADDPIQTTCATGRVVDHGGAPVLGALVSCDGDTTQANGYQGPSEAYTAVDGTFCVPVKTGSSFRCIARKGAFVSVASATFTSGGAAAACGSTSCTAIGDFALTDPLIRIVLTWGAAPSDLDSHLVGADFAAVDGTYTWFADQGSLVAAPFVELDTDDTSSYGPEITSFVHGAKAQRYRFCVDNFSGSPTINQSSAVVDAFLGGQHLRLTVPTTATTASLWRVLEFTLDAAGSAGGVRAINDFVEPTTSIPAACMQ